ncbi:Aste57867_12890 [Aphanomyces stellatus]|uniref:Aste57867_12890 protein n=1 Tax=Aphanomyces stellatus TaxID=120398 RepID=A0A485KWQ4_9STRA|nr:hypothetical protein As57867_012842 [Aphanomyces stellatus]VFT89737.1 Aste57867_12890 [Aphanomyces stellatus]
MTDFSQATDVRAYIQETEWASKPTAAVQDLTLLSGGMVNYVWRVTFADASSVILKHFPPALRLNPNFAFPQERCQLEHIALAAVATQFATTVSAWCAPKPLYFDDAQYVILQQDMPGVPLYDLFKADLDHATPSTDDLAWIAEALLAFLRDVQSLAVPDISRFANSPLTPLMNRMYLRNLPRMTEMDVPDASSWCDRAAACDAFAPTSFLFGDFWPNSILVDFHTKRIAVIDWELARTGHYGMDMTQMMANLALMGRGKPFKKALAQDMVAAMVKAWKATPEPESDKFDFVAAYVKRAVQLTQYTHWELDDVKATVQDLVAAAPALFE